MHLDRETYIEIAPDEVTPLATTHSDWARPFHDLLLLSLGVAISLTDVRVEVADTYGQHRFASLLFGANQNDSPRSFDPHRLREDDSLCLLFPEDAGADFESVLPEWMALREDLNCQVPGLMEMWKPRSESSTVSSSRVAACEAVCWAL